MFDIGFWELTLVALVSLLVIGPERLPKVARLAGFWVGKARRMVSSVKQEIKQELYSDELIQSINDHSPAKDVRRLLDDTAKTVSSLKETGKTIKESAQSSQEKQPSSEPRKPHGE